MSIHCRSLYFVTGFCTNLSKSGHENYQIWSQIHYQIWSQKITKSGHKFTESGHKNLRIWSQHPATAITASLPRGSAAAGRDSIQILLDTESGHKNHRIWSQILPDR